MNGRSALSPPGRPSLLGALLCLLTSAVLAAPPPSVIVAEVVNKPFADRIEALGTLRANESVALTATVTETINALYFDDGERVTAGTVAEAARTLVGN